MSELRVAPVHLIAGEDAALTSQKLSEVLEDVLRQLELGHDAVEEYGQLGANDALQLGPVLDACLTLPFLNAARVVVLRDVESLSAEQTKEVIAYLEEPLETTVLVMTFVAERPRRPPAALSKAVSAKGLQYSSQPTGAERSKWIASHVKDASLKLDPTATEELQSHLGEDISRLEGILETLESAYGPDATIHAEDLEPYLGAAGTVAPWDLTDALDAGDSAGAITALHRLTEAGERHPLALLSSLHRHYGAMLALDGANLSNDQQAAELTGLGPFPARKALQQARRLGHERIARAIQLLAKADLDLRGQIGWPPILVLEVLIARLAQNSRVQSQTTARRRSVTRPR